MNRIIFALLCASISLPAFAGKLSCDDLKAKIEAKLAAKGVKHYTLEIVPAAEVKDGKADGGKVVGSCDGGTKRIVYRRG